MNKNNNVKSTYDKTDQTNIKHKSFAIKANN